MRLTNREKEQYLSDMMIFRSQAFCSELIRRKEFADKMPRILYKYRTFDKYSCEMLEESYVYLAPVKELDDPFDCLTNPGVDEKTKDEAVSIGLSMVNYVINLVSKLGNIKFNKKEVKKLVLKSYSDGEYDEEKARKAFNGYNLINEQGKQIFLDCLRNIDGFTKTIVEDKSMVDLASISFNPGERVGVFSASTKRDNKVMWSLYGDKYKGYCVEYDIPDDPVIRFNLCPVIYKKNDDNNFIRKMVELAIANIIRFASEGQLSNGVGCMNELFCVKDADWAFQDEWRLIGNAQDHCNRLKLKAIYLGFKVEEDNLKMVKEIAKKNGFKVFLMDAPKGSKKITYTQVM